MYFTSLERWGEIKLLNTATVCEIEVYAGMTRRPRYAPNMTRKIMVKIYSMEKACNMPVPTCWRDMSCTRVFIFWAKFSSIRSPFAEHPHASRFETIRALSLLLLHLICELCWSNHCARKGTCKIGYHTFWFSLGSDIPDDSFCQTRESSNAALFLVWNDQTVSFFFFCFPCILFSICAIAWHGALFVNLTSLCTPIYQQVPADGLFQRAEGAHLLRGALLQWPWTNQPIVSWLAAQEGWSSNRSSTLHLLKLYPFIVDLDSLTNFINVTQPIYAAVPSGSWQQDDDSTITSSL